MAARAGVEPTTLRLKAIDSTNEPSRLTSVNIIFLQRPQKRSRGNQLMNSRLFKTKSIGSGSDPESQAGRQNEMNQIMMTQANIKL